MADAPATPIPAATILLLRRGGKHGADGVEVLMVQRSTKASFMPGVWVFPGGIIEGDETPEVAAARELHEETGIELGAEVELVGWSRWITPEVVPVRFDTYFFVALAGPHVSPKADMAEVFDAGWFGPRSALDSHAAGKLKLVFPTIKTLENLIQYETTDAVIAAARQREVEPVLPRVVGTREDHRVLLPWDDGYEEAVESIGELPE
jgi:8-oxo-dGTP pyrophosphatase MutT (NUDIX family)